MKKFLSILLVLSLVAALALPASAANEKQEYNGNPVIIVRGIDSSLYYEDGRNAISLNSGKVLGVLLECVITRFALKDKDALFDSFAEIVDDVFEPISCDANGESTHPVSRKQYTKALSEYKFSYYDETEGGLTKEAAKRYGAENVYYFTYDYRKSPKQLASELNSLVETAKADSGKDKVNLICASMGCIETNAYFYYFDGYKNVDTAVYLSGAHNGLVVCGDALSGNISFNKDIVKETLSNLVDGNVFVRLLMDVFDALGAFSFLADYFTDWVANYFDEANDVVLRDRLGTMPGLWSFCPDEYFDTAYEKIFAGHEADYPVCETIKEVGAFNKQTENILAKAYAEGVKISFVSHYNTVSIPVYDNATMNSDGVIETRQTSNFATVAPYGETLSNDYLASVSQENRKYISPDNVIDASTALYKDNTWFVKNAVHVACNYGTEMNNFAFMLLESKQQPTIYNIPGYTQFLTADENQNLEILK